jgi:hypothetical protein
LSPALFAKFSLDFMGLPYTSIITVRRVYEKAVSTDGKGAMQLENGFLAFFTAVLARSFINIVVSYA